MKIVGPYVLDTGAQELQRQHQDIRKRFLNVHAESIHAEVTGSIGVLHYYMAHHAMNAAVQKSKMIHASKAPAICKEDRMKITGEIQEYEDTDRFNWSTYNEAMDEWLSLYPHHCLGPG
jgi:hypothetical protein